MRAGLFACEQGSWLAGYSIRRCFTALGGLGMGRGALSYPSGTSIYATRVEGFKCW